MRVSALSLVVCVGLVACGPSRRAWQAPPPTSGAVEASAFAVISLASPLWLAPAREGPSVWGVAPEAVYGGSGVPSLAVVRVLGERDGWVAIETLGEPADAHCAPDVGGLEALRVRFFVPSGALVPVTTREIVQELDDGTRIELDRGAPLEPLPERDLHRVRLGGLRFVARLARTEVGTRYLPSARPSLAAASRALRADVLAARVPILGRTGRVDADLPRPEPVHAVVPRGGELLAELRPRCGRLVVRVPTHALSDLSDEPSDEPSVEDEPAPTDAPSFPAGTRIRWRDGREAGVVTRALTLAREVESPGGLRCFLHPLRRASATDPSPDVELCFEPRAVLEPGLGRARQLGSPR